MPTVISGDTGVSKADVNSVDTAAIQAAAITAAKLSGAQTGSAPVFGARAWCVFDGTLAGTNAPTAGGNVTNVTRNSVGNYTINFTTAMPDGSYAMSGSVPAQDRYVNGTSTGSKTAASAGVSVQSGGSALSDLAGVSVMFVR